MMSVLSEIAKPGRLYRRMASWFDLEAINFLTSRSLKNRVPFYFSCLNKTMTDTMVTGDVLYDIK